MPRRAVDAQRAAQRGHPVGQPDQAGAAAGVGAAGAVVTDHDVQQAVTACDQHVDLFGPRVFGRVGQRLGHHVVRTDLHRLGWPTAREIDVEHHGDR